MEHLIELERYVLRAAGDCAQDRGALKAAVFYLSQHLVRAVIRVNAEFQGGVKRLSAPNQNWPFLGATFFIG